MPLTLEEMKDLIKAQIDPDLFVEVCELTTEELVDAFEDQILERWDKLEELCNVEQDES